MARVLGALLLLGLALQAHGAVRPKVLATFVPLTAHALAIAGPDADVEQLLPASSGAHDYQPRPSDAARVAGADLIILNGLGLEAWLEPMLVHRKEHAVLVDTSAGMRMSLVADEGGCPHCSAAAAHDHAGGNPHVWLDPSHAISQASVIAEALAKIDPAKAPAYRHRFQEYAERIRALEARGQELLAFAAGRHLVTLHDAFPYLARRFGLVAGPVLERFPGRDPSPREIAAVIDAVREAGVGVVFTEAGRDSGLLRVVARETGARIETLDTLESGEASAEAYLVRMGANLDLLATALR